MLAGLEEMEGERSRVRRGRDGGNDGKVMVKVIFTPSLLTKDDE